MNFKITSSNAFIIKIIFIMMSDVDTSITQAVAVQGQMFKGNQVLGSKYATNGIFRSTWDKNQGVYGSFPRMPFLILFSNTNMF